MSWRKQQPVSPNPRPIPDYSQLPLFREVLPVVDHQFFEQPLEVDEYRWILSLKQIDWFKFFEKHTEIHDLARYAADSIPNNPVGFLKPEWVNRALNRYTDACPQWAKDYAENFRKAKTVQEMREWFEVIQTRME